MTNNVYSLNKNKRIKIVLIGIGSMGRNHLRVISQDNNFELVAIVDKSSNILSIPVPSPYTNSIKRIQDIRELNNLDFECAVIATPTSTHFEIASQLLEMKKDILLEKPIGISFEEGIKLDELAIKVNQKLYIGHIERCNPAIQKLKQVIDSGLIGEAIHFATTRVGGYPENVKEGNNVLLDLAVHDLDIVNQLSGPFEIRSSICHSTWNPDVFDTSEILLTNARGASASIHVNWITPTKIRTTRVTGTKGVCLVDHIKQTCTLYGGMLDKSDKYNDNVFNFEQLKMAYKNSDMINFGVLKSEPLKNQLTEFYKALTHQNHILATAKEAAEIVRMSENAINKSIKGIQI